MFPILTLSLTPSSSPTIASDAHDMTKQTSYCHIKLWQRLDMFLLCIYSPALRVQTYIILGPHTLSGPRK